MGGKRAKKRKMKNRTKFTVFSMMNLIWYTVAVLWLSANDHLVPDALTVAWFSAWTVELAILFGIKIKDKASGDDAAG